MVLVGGVLLGSVDLIAQRTLPYPWANLANSSAIWAIGAFGIGGWVRASRWWVPARQFVYGRSALGRPEVLAAADWAATYSGGTRVVPIQERLDSAAAIERLGDGVDIVVCAIDSPPNVELMVNEACFALDVPFVHGGLNYSTLAYWSVAPTSTRCSSSRPAAATCGRPRAPSRAA